MVPIVSAVEPRTARACQDRQLIWLSSHKRKCVLWSMHASTIHRECIFVLVIT